MSKKLFLLASLLVLIMSGCSQPAATTPTAVPTQAEPEAVVIRMGTQPWIGYGPWWIAKEKGIFEKYNLQVELSDFVQDQEVNAALASGNLAAANLATHTAIKLYEKGLDVRIILLEDASYEADAMLAGADIASIADIKGKTVAYEEGATSDLLLNYALAQNNLSLADIQPKPMPASDAGATLIAGQVDVAVTYEPYISEARGQNDQVSLLYTAAERPGLISDVLVVSSSFLKENPQAVRDLLKAWDEALAFYKSNPDEAKAIIAENVGSAPEELVTAFDGVQFYDLSENSAQLSGDFKETIKDVASVSQSIGLIDAIPDLAQLIDPAYLK